MKSIKYVIPVLALLAFAFVLSGCPGKNMMAGDSMEKKDMMADDGMEKEAMMEKDQ